MRRRMVLRLLAGASCLGAGRVARAATPGKAALPDFLRRLSPATRRVLVDDAKLLIGWVTDAAVLDMPLQKGELVDRRSGFSDAPGFAPPTPLNSLDGRYRLLAEPRRGHDYYGIMFGMLAADDSVLAVVVANRLFRLPVILREPAGLMSDIYANAGLLIGFRTAALDAATAFAAEALAEARRLKVPLIATGQSQAGGTAQLQIAHLVADGAAADAVGFVTYNGTCSAAAIRHCGISPARVPGVNFSKDRDPFVGPHSNLSNAIGLQIYIHADGSAGLAPGGSYLAAAFHPREHFLDSFTGVSLAAALESVTG